MKYIPTILIALMITMGGCIGTDIVTEELIPERVVLTARADSIKVGENFLFGAQFFNSLGIQTEEVIQWTSDDEAIISINSDGLATAESPGNATISATARGVSDMILVNSGGITNAVSETRTGTFEGVNDYTVTGDFNLSDETGELVLTFGDGFTASNGPGLFIYLSNSGTSVTGGVELGSLKSNSGAQSYDVPDDVLVNTYDFVVVYCKPFGLPFGNGEFDN